jgi:hypothetical protein
MLVLRVTSSECLLLCSDIVRCNVFMSTIFNIAREDFRSHIFKILDLTVFEKTVRHTVTND